MQSGKSGAGKIAAGLHPGLKLRSVFESIADVGRVQPAVPCMRPGGFHPPYEFAGIANKHRIYIKDGDKCSDTRKPHLLGIAALNANLQQQ